MKRKRVRAGSAAALLMAAAAWGCATGGGGGAVPRVERSANPDVTELRVINTREFRMEIRVQTAFHDQRLGQVQGLRTATFEIPQAIIGSGREMWFVADPLGGSGVWVSSPIFVHQGDRIQWRIQGDASRTIGG